jgi:hypothetical protein
VSDSVRNPIRLKNIDRRFLPAACVVALALAASEPSKGSLLAGAALVVAGLTLRTWGAGHLVKRDQLTTTGPYAHLRHPLYAGTLLICGGFGVSLGPAGWLLVALTALWFSVLYFPAKERRESDLLEQRYGYAYVAYRARVPALVPSSVARAPASGVTEHWRLAHYAANNELGTLLGVVVGAALLALRAAAA